MSMEFNGFFEETVEFFSELKENNNKTWFTENKKRYEQYVMEPARAFVLSMESRLQDISGNIIADPKVNRSLFRINRDVRFSNDKSPYKTNMGIIFWEGPGKRMERPGFYFHLEPDSLMVGGGLHMIPKDLMTPYRESVRDEENARELSGIIEKIKDSGMEVGGLHYKKLPRGYSEEHPYSYLLKHNGVYGMKTSPIPDEFYSSELMDYSLEKFRTMNPLNRWLLDHLY